MFYKAQNLSMNSPGNSFSIPMGQLSLKRHAWNCLTSTVVIIMSRKHPMIYSLLCMKVIRSMTLFEYPISLSYLKHYTM